MTNSRRSNLTVHVSAIKDVNSLIEDLTVPNPEAKAQGRFAKGPWAKKVPDKLTFYQLNDKDRTVTVPRNLNPSYFNSDIAPIKDSTEDGTLICRMEGDLSPQNQKPFWDYQQKFWDEKVFPAADMNDDVLIVMSCGNGKTRMAMEMINLRGRNTLVLCTTWELMRQWKEAIESTLPHLTVSIYEDGKKSWQMTDVVISTYDLMSKDRFTDESWFRHFGHFIGDEIHRIGATTYNTLLEKVPSKYRTSLTATFRRKDGMEKILQHHCGIKCYLPNQNPNAWVFPIATGSTYRPQDFIDWMKKATGMRYLQQYSEVLVADRKTGDEYGVGVLVHKDIKNDSADVDFGGGRLETISGKKYKFFIKGPMSTARADTVVGDDIKRLENYAIPLIDLSIEAGRKVLVLSRRKNTLIELWNRYKETTECAVIISDKAAEIRPYLKELGITYEENKEFALNEARVVFGIDKIAEEGLDLPRMDTLLFIHPQSDIEQAAGRVKRRAINGNKKDQPLIFYPRDNFSVYDGYWKKAEDMFADLGDHVQRKMTIAEFKRFVK